MTDMYAEWKEWIESTELSGIRNEFYSRICIRRPYQISFLLNLLSSPLLYGSSLQQQTIGKMKACAAEHPDWLVFDEEREDENDRLDYQRREQKMRRLENKLYSSMEFRRLQKQFSDYERKMSGKKKLLFQGAAEMLVNAVRVSEICLAEDEELDDLFSDLVSLIGNYPSLFKIIILNSSMYGLDHSLNGSFDVLKRRMLVADHLLYHLLEGRMVGVEMDERQYLERLADLLERSSDDVIGRVSTLFDQNLPLRKALLRQISNSEQQTAVISGDSDTKKKTDEVLGFPCADDGSFSERKTGPDLQGSPVRGKKTAGVKTPEADRTADFLNAARQTGKTNDEKPAAGPALLPIYEEELMRMDPKDIPPSFRTAVDLFKNTDRINGILTFALFQAQEPVKQQINDIFEKRKMDPNPHFAKEAAKRYQKHYRNSGYPFSVVLGMFRLIYVRTMMDPIFNECSMLEQFTILFSTSDDYIENYLKLKSQLEKREKQMQDGDSEGNGLVEPENYMRTILQSGPAFHTLSRLAIDLLYRDSAHDEIDDEVKDVLTGFILDHPEAYGFEESLDTPAEWCLYFYRLNSRSYLTHDEVRMLNALFALFRLRLSQAEKKRLAGEILGCMSRPSKSFSRAVRSFMDDYDSDSCSFDTSAPYRHDAAILFLAAMLTDPFFLAPSTPYYIFNYLENQSSQNWLIDALAVNKLIFNLMLDEEDTGENEPEEAFPDDEKEEEEPNGMEDRGDMDSPAISMLNRLADGSQDSQAFDKLIGLWSTEAGSSAMDPHEYPYQLPYGWYIRLDAINRFWNSLAESDQIGEIWSKTPDPVKGLLINLLIEKLDQNDRMMCSQPTSVFEKGKSENHLALLRGQIDDLLKKVDHLEEETGSLQKAESDRNMDEIVSSAWTKGYKTARNECVDEIRDLKSRVQKLEKEKQEWTAQKNELSMLREAVYQTEEKEPADRSRYQISKEEEQELRDFFSRHKIVLVGGHERLLRALDRKYGLNRVFNNENYSVEMFSQADTAFIFPKFMNHSIYYKAMSAIQRKQMDTLYLNFRNLDVTECKILEFVRSKKA